MPLSTAEVETAYRLILERTPSAKETATVAAQHENLGKLRQTLLNSEEFYRKFDPVRTAFPNRVNPVLVHLQIPAAVDQATFEALAAEDSLQPNVHADTDSLATLATKPRSERFRLRYVYGDLGAQDGEALRVPYVHLCTIAQPGPRLYRIYRMSCGPEDEAEMSFGTYLEYSLDSAPHRVELDNGQVRRLAGRQNASSFGQEHELLPLALHNALAPSMIIGLFERPGPLAARLVSEGVLRAADLGLPDERTQEDVAGYDAALNGLGDSEKAIFNAYTAWDNYLYDVCNGLLFPPAEYGPA